jgi:hypothetical protein
VAGEVALQGADGLASCLAFGNASREVVLGRGGAGSRGRGVAGSRGCGVAGSRGRGVAGSRGRGVVWTAVEDDGVEGAVELAVAAAAEAVASCEAA